MLQQTASKLCVSICPEKKKRCLYHLQIPMAQGKTTLGLKVTTNLAMNHPEAMAIQF
jgi:hypothetical protein